MAQLPAPRPAPGGDPVSYRRIYADPVNDPVSAAPEGYLAGYRFLGEDPPTSVTLRELTLHMGERRPVAFLALADQGGSPKVHVLHRLMKFYDLPGERPSGFNDRVLALLGDIGLARFPIVEVPGLAFHITNHPTWVLNLEQMEAAVAEEGEGDDYTNLGPYDEDTPETEVVAPRHLQLIPNKYAALLLNHPDGVPPRQAHRMLASALAADDNLLACRDVLMWTRAACTARGGDGPQSGASGLLLPYRALHLPSAVHAFAMGKIYGDLPALRANLGHPPQAPGALGGAADVVAVIRALQEAQRGGRQREGGGRDGHDDDLEDDGRREPKSLREAYRETYVTLLRHCRVETVNEVAPVWKRLANAAKAEHQTVLQQECTKVCLAHQLAPELYSPVITATIKQMVTNLNFAGVGIEELNSGLNPFLVSYTGSKAHLEAIDTAEVARQLDLGHQSASIADIRALKDKEKVRLPKDLHQVAITLFRFAVLTECLFQSATQDPHPLVGTLWRLAKEYTTRLPFILDRYHELAGTEHYASYPARILRRVQVQVVEYLQGVAAAPAGFAAVDQAPTFSTMLTYMQHGTFPASCDWMPLPASYRAITPSQASQRSTATTALASGVTHSAQASTITTGGGSSAVSALTSPTNATGASHERQQRETNPSPDPEFMALTLKPGLGELLRLHRPPTNSAGKEQCVSWWAKGSCFSRCSRQATHQPFGSPAERARLLAHIKDHLVVGA